MPEDKRDLRKELLAEIKDTAVALADNSPVGGARAKERMRVLLMVLDRLDSIKVYNEA